MIYCELRFLERPFRNFKDNYEERSTTAFRIACFLYGSATA